MKLAWVGNAIFNCHFKRKGILHVYYTVSEPLIRIASTRMRRLYIHSLIQIHYMSLLYKFNQYLSGGRILVPVLIRVLDAIGLEG